MFNFLKHLVAVEVCTGLSGMSNTDALIKLDCTNAVLQELQRIQWLRDGMTPEEADWETSPLL